MTNFNENQLEAIKANLKSVLVVAGAGSGKTSILTNRIKFLVNNFNISPKKILAFTFTNKAANEMKHRLKDLIQDSSFEFLGTFHSICLRILKEDLKELNFKNLNNDFKIIDSSDQNEVIKTIYLNNNYDKKILSLKTCLPLVQKLKSKNLNKDNIETYIDKYLKKLLSDEKTILVNVYLKYIEFIQNNNFLDYDDLIKYTKILFETKKDVLQKWQNRFEYILVDEFQDTDFDQFSIICLLSKNKDNVFVVGDADQMIYSWRGAYEDIFNDFQSTFKNHQLIILDKNYRSSNKILECANLLIKNNKNRIEKNLYTDLKKESNVAWFNFESQSDEANFVVQKINELKIKHEKIYGKNSFNFNSVAILYRTNNMTAILETKLQDLKIPYKIYGGFKFYEKKTVKDMLAYLRIIANANDEIALFRTYNLPKRGISENTYNFLKEYAIENKITTFEAFENVEKINSIKQNVKIAIYDYVNLISKWKNDSKKLSLDELIFIINDDLNYVEQFKDEEDKSKALNNIEQLALSIKDYQQKNPNSSIDDYLNYISLLTTLDENNNWNSVSLMTVHNSKGLEFENVFIIQFNDGDFPHERSLTENNLEEERRLAYVAITRAKTNLFFISTKSTGFNMKQKLPSRFIFELLNPFVEAKTNNLKNNIADYSTKNFEFKKDYSKYFNTNEFDYQIGDCVSHSIFGDGVVIDVMDDMLNIQFKKEIKTILKNHKSLKRKY